MDFLAPGQTILLLRLLLVSLLVAAPASAQQSTAPTVDLGYAEYRGYRDETTGLNVWRGIRYAAPPTAERRWQRPSAPVDASGDGVLDAVEFGAACPQAMPQFTGRAGAFIAGDEDCLFLNVYAPEQVEDGELLPVFFSIHGGGYGLGSADTDVSGLMMENDKSFVTVTIQYRLGAFGFLSSEEVKQSGVLNAGLLDQRFALEWVRRHISKFGGDPERVTIAGESAGAGSVLLHAIAEDGALGTSLFQNIIAASPWVPTQPYYDDPGPTQHYNDLVEAVGCTAGQDSFGCLVAAESLTLQFAANRVSSTPPTFYGNWAFVPVTDGEYITEAPSILLGELRGRVNGARALIGNNANEGPLLIPPTIRTEDDLVAWIKGNFVNLSDQNITSVLEAYPSVSGPVDLTHPRYDTDGFGPATAVNMSQAATGHQQRAYNIGSEAAVICPSYWMASAFTGEDKSAWHYQYSVPFAVHGADLTAYYGEPTQNQGPDLVKAIRRVYGNLITKDNPSVSNRIANGEASSDPEAAHAASDWPAWTDDTPLQLNLNQTGGVPFTSLASNGATVTQFRDPGLRNDFSLVDSYAWEGGRGERCAFWKDLSPYVPQ